MDFANTIFFIRWFQFFLQLILFLGLDNFNICNIGIRCFQYFELEDF